MKNKNAIKIGILAGIIGLTLTFLFIKIDLFNKILPSEKPEEFCGWSTYAKCKTDADCNMGGCSGQVCEGKGEGTMTDCQARDCYYVAEYGCKCIDNKCQWSK